MANYLLWVNDLSDGIFDRSYAVITNSYGQFVESIDDELWDVSEGVIITDEGAELFEEWQDNNSRGYDLCNGRAYGLANQYTKYEIFQHICNNYKA